MTRIYREVNGRYTEIDETTLCPATKNELKQLDEKYKMFTGKEPLTMVLTEKNIYVFEDNGKMHTHNLNHND